MTDVFLAQLARLHRRRSLVRVARYGLGSGAIAAVCGVMTVVLTHASLRQAVTIAIVAVGAAGAVVGLAVLLHRRDARDTALAVDERLGSDHHITTALEYLHDRDPFAQLIVRGARARLSDVVPARVFPFEPPGGPRTVVTVLALSAAMAVAAIVVAPGTQTIDRSRTSNGVSSADGVAAAGARPREGAASGDAEQRAVTVVSPSPQRAAAAPPRERVDDPAAVGRGLRSAVDLPDRPAESPAGGRGSGTQRSDGQRQDTTGAGAERNRSGMALAGTGAAGRSPSPGGVSVGAASQHGPAEPPPAPAADYANQYSTGWTRAQAALAQERIPSELRDYVRAYFLAIQP